MWLGLEVKKIKMLILYSISNYQKLINYLLSMIYENYFLNFPYFFNFFLSLVYPSQGFY